MIHTIIEPFRIKAVEPIRMSTRDERKAWLEEAKLNVFLIPADRVLLDVLAFRLFSFLARLMAGRISAGMARESMVYRGRTIWPVLFERPRICMNTLTSPAGCATIMCR